MSTPSVYPSGTTIYDPEKCWPGYTVFTAHEHGLVLIDMNGHVVQLWKDLQGFPAKLLPGGYVMGSLGTRSPKFGFMDGIDLAQIDWEGNMVWKFDQYEFIEDPGQESRWMARQHHDYQREGNPVGYYVPGMDPMTDQGNTLILGHKDVKNPMISEKPLLDDVIYEVSWGGDIVWEWVCSDHFEEMNFSEEARNTMYRNPTMVVEPGLVGDWMHMNSMSLLGPNHHYEEGDNRFHPDNIIWSGRQTNIMGITEKSTGKIVWQLGPDYDGSEALKKLGWLIGMHHAHMIPKGLPGEGNILVFDNGGFAGYGSPNPGSPTGHNNALRDYSRIIEFNPITLEVVWQYSYEEAGFLGNMNNYKFYSPLISSAQRLPNGNTLITEGSGGRLIEVTKEHKIVWEFINPYFSLGGTSNFVYRSYRLPYDWVPQLDEPKETEVNIVDKKTFRVPGVEWKEERKIVSVEGTLGYNSIPQLCVDDIDSNYEK